MRKVLTAALLSGAIAVPAAAEPSKEAKAFGAREFVQDISLSPDGKRVAMVEASSGRGARLVVGDFESGAITPVTSVSGDPERFDRCHWSTNSRIVCRIYGDTTTLGVLTGFTRLIAINADGTNPKMLSQTGSSRSLGPTLNGGNVIDWTGQGKESSILVTRSHVPEQTTGSRFGSDAEGLGVESIDTITLARRAVEPPKPMAVEYISDGRGTVRVMGLLTSATGGYIGETIAYSYRKPGERAWERLGTFQLTQNARAGFNPYAVDPDLNVVYGFDDSDGFKKLVRINLDGSLKKEIVVERPGVDVDGLIQIGRQQRVVGASWAGEVREFTFFDPELKALATSLGRAIPNLPQIRFVDASANEKQLLLSASSDDHPGIYYIYDKGTKKLEEVMPARPQLALLGLGKMKPITYRAADGTMIPGYLTLPANSTGKGLPAIVMPHGGPSARDEWGFDWLAQFFAARGYAVLQPNFRGSSGYGEAWFEKNGFQSWRTAIGDINDGGKWLLAQGIAAPGKIAIVGWSYGGYAALQSPALDPDLFKAIVAIAPVTDLEQLRTDSQMYTNFKLVDKFIGTGAHVREGSPARLASGIKAPVLMFHGDRDQNVRIGHSRLMADRLKDAGKKVELVEYKGLAHSLNDSTARTEMLDKSDTFLRMTLGL